MTRIYPTAVVRRFVREQIPVLSRGPLQVALERARADEREGLVAAVRRVRELLEAAAGPHQAFLRVDDVALEFVARPRNDDVTV